jgi:hypothetical protein
VNRPLPHPWRIVVAVVVCVLLGLIGALAIASPARADHTETQLSGSCAWNPETSGWAVTWTVDSGAPEDVGTFGLVEVVVTPTDSTLEGIATTADGALDAHQPVVGVQQVPEGATSASLAVRARWDNGHEDGALRSAEVAIPADCEAPESPTELGQWTFDCQSLAITIDNPTEENVALTFVPSLGDPVDNVVVAGGVSVTVQFPSSEGLSVDVLSQGRSIVDADDPIEISAARWNELRCEEQDDEGQGGGLAATGTPVALIAVGALALLALGAGLFLLARRRRIRFTA